MYCVVIYIYCIVIYIYVLYSYIYICVLYLYIYCIVLYIYSQFFIYMIMGQAHKMENLLTRVTPSGSIDLGLKRLPCLQAESHQTGSENGLQTSQMIPGNPGQS